jgi:nucleotide-binding universal stress UspA family protein
MGNAPAKLESARMKRILVPIDFSDVTPAAIDLARQLGQAFGAAIHLVHVKELTAAPAPGALEYGLTGVSELAPIAGVPVPGFKPSSERIAEDEDQKSKLAKWQAEIAQEGIEVRLHEVAGVVAEQILNLADQLDANMIVMGRHGHGAMYTLLLGSATQGVLKHSTRPVLLVPAARSVSRN